MEIPLKPHDRVIAAFNHRDIIVIVTKRGEVFQIQDSGALGDALRFRCTRL